MGTFLALSVFLITIVLNGKSNCLNEFRNLKLNLLSVTDEPVPNIFFISLIVYDDFLLVGGFCSFLSVIANEVRQSFPIKLKWWLWFFLNVQFDFWFVIWAYKSSSLNAETQRRKVRRDFFFAFSYNSLRPLRFYFFIRVNSVLVCFLLYHINKFELQKDLCGLEMIHKDFFGNRFPGRVRRLFLRYII